MIDVSMCHHVARTELQFKFQFMRPLMGRTRTSFPDTERIQSRARGPAPIVLVRTSNLPASNEPFNRTSIRRAILSHMNLRDLVHVVVTHMSHESIAPNAKLLLRPPIHAQALRISSSESCGA